MSTHSDVILLFHRFHYPGCHVILQLGFVINAIQGLQRLQLLSQLIGDKSWEKLSALGQGLRGEPEPVNL